MSEAGRTVSDMLVSESGLLQAFADEGVTVVETPEGMRDGRVAWYSHTHRIVALRPKLLQRQRIAALAHEWQHCLRGDDGCQDESVERHIDEDVARLLVDPLEYAWVESQFPPTPGAFAAILDLPLWVIEAYMRTLAKGSPAPLRCGYLAGVASSSSVGW